MGVDEKKDVVRDFLVSSEKLSAMLSGIISDESIVDNMSDDEKKRAAYALNMCTVSVSQIIDYKDVNVLEQEYEAILNNLNLEQMPKDEALLHILRQILDTITYFRIEEGDKEMIEKEYQQKMKNAIWSAVPNFGLIVAGGNPLTMAFSLASQVGIGYMNYRRNKAEYGLEHEKQLWQLQRTAIEQFNGLRRELFDTAWRLADTYKFPDEYRLTERQIKQYNTILMDSNELRKYERLESIKDKFEAYPPFWYFIGNAANYISGDRGINIPDGTRLKYRQKALEYFEKYEDLNRFNILREDQLVAACALEHIDILLLDENDNKGKICELLDTAVKMSGNSLDILEMCATTYLRIKERDSAASILRMLVNEDYNRIINAQLLSSIYVFNKNRADYELLSTRVDPDYLYPMPKDDNQDINQLEEEFGGRQKAALKRKYEMALGNLVQKYTVEWNRITSEFDADVDYPDTFFYDTNAAKAERKNQALRVFSDREKKEYYQGRIAEANYELNLLRILNEMCDSLFAFKGFENEDLQTSAENAIKIRIAEEKDDINDIQQSMTDGSWVLEGYLLSQKISLMSIVYEAVRLYLEYAYTRIEAANINEITYMEGDLRNFCNKNEIPEPDVKVGDHDETLFTKSVEHFLPELFGHQAVIAKRNADFMNDMTSFIKERMGNVTITGNDVSVYYADSDFNGYFYSHAFEKDPSIKSHAIMVIKDNSKKKYDLVFTTNGIIDVVKDKVRNLTPYSEIKLKSDAIVIYNELGKLGKNEYKNTAIDINALYSVIRELGSKFVRNVEEKIEYVDKVVTVKLMNAWFRNRAEAMDDNVTRVYAIPTKEMLDHFGYHLDVELDPEKHLLQCYFDKESKEILGMRIIRYEEIESNFQAKLIENDGYLQVGK